MKAYRPSTILGIELEGGRMTAALLARSGGGRVQIRRTAQARLSLDPLTGAPDLVGREIRDCLAKAGIREKRCVVCAPLNWALTLRAEIPDLSEAEIASYLSVQAERGLPFTPEDLTLSTSRYRTSAGGPGQATLVAIPNSHLNALQLAIKSAGLRPVGVTFGVAAIVEAFGRRNRSVVAILAREGSVNLAVGVGGGIVALRALEERRAADQIEKDVDADEIARHLRITLGQLPADLREAIRDVRVFAPGDRAAAKIDELRDSIGRLGLSVEPGSLDEVAPVVWAGPEGDAQSISPAPIVAAAARLLNEAPGLDFFVPRPSRFLSWPQQFASRRMLRVYAGAAAAVAIVAGVFLAQAWRLSSLEKEWKLIEPRVRQTEALQEQIRKVRSWFDDTPVNLLIARKLTEAFPEEGTVWAKTVEIKDTSAVSCSGNATSNREWLQALDRLRATKGIEDLQVQQVRGENPMQFALSFRWNPGGADGS